MNRSNQKIRKHSNYLELLDTRPSSINAEKAHLSTEPIPLPLPQRPLLLALLMSILLLKIPEANHALDKVMIRELLVRSRSILDAQLAVNDEAGFCNSALDQFLECGLILAKWDDAGADGLRFEPRLAERNLEEAFL